MEKFIKPSLGLSLRSNDYDAPESSLQVALGVIPDKSGSLRPIPDTETLSKLPENLSPVILHALPNREKRLILWDDDKNTLCFSPFPAEHLELTPIESTLTKKPEGVSILGNIVIIPTEEGISNLMVQGDSYRQIAPVRPLQMEFALGTQGTEVSDHIETIGGLDPTAASTILQHIGQSPSSGGHGTPSHLLDPTDPIWLATQNAISNAIYGRLNEYVASVTKTGKFHQPFFVRAAMRLFDGSSTALSAPVLMIPFTYPLIRQTSGSLSEENNTVSLTTGFSIHTKPANLLFRFKGSRADIESMREIVTHIDFYVSPQIYTYEQSGKVNGRLVNLESYPILCHSGTMRTALNDQTENTERPDTRPPGKYNLSPTLGKPYYFDDNREQYLTGKGQAWVLESKSDEDIELRIRNNSQFYRIASIELSSLEEIMDSDGFYAVDIKENILTNLAVQPPLQGDSQTSHTLLPKSTTVYNSRVILSNLMMNLFPGFSINTQSQYLQMPDELSAERPRVAIFVKLTKNGMEYWVKTKEASVWNSPDSQFPRRLWYPDPNAEEMRIFFFSSPSDYLPAEAYSINLTSHDHLNGAYWFAGLNKISLIKEDPLLYISTADSDSTVIPRQNTIYHSEVNNPFYYPAVNTVTIGSGIVYELRAAVQALSQGQFGQFPLYAFTNEGIWAISISSTGTFSSIQPVSREVCINPDSITQVDKSVLFLSFNGLMMISGTSTENISTSLEDDTLWPSILESDFSPLIKYLKLSLKDIPVGEVEFIPIDTRIAYDYLNKRIILYSLKSDVVFLFSIESKAWGMTRCRIKDSINAYPDLYLLMQDNSICTFPDDRSFKSSLDNLKDAVIMTRPLNFSAPEIGKRVTAAFVRGAFDRKGVRTALLGSNNLMDWHLIWSSASERLEGFRGTPFRWFRLLTVASLNPRDTITGFSFHLEPVKTKSPR